MDRENTPMKQRQKRSGGNRRSSIRSNASSTGGGKTASNTNSAAAVSGIESSQRAFRSNSQRTRNKNPTATAPTPSMILTKHPPTILRAPNASNLASITTTAASHDGASFLQSASQQSTGSTSSASQASMVPIMMMAPPAPVHSAGGRSGDSDTRGILKTSPTMQQQRESLSSSSGVGGGYLHVNAVHQRPSTSSSSPDRLYNPSAPPAPSSRLHPSGEGMGGRTLYIPPPSSSASSSTTSSPIVKKMLGSSGGPRPTASSFPPSHHAITPPRTSVKLISPQLQFATDLNVKLSTCFDLINFTVVGVLGMEAVGKSTVLSLITEGKRTKKNDQTQFSAMALDQSTFFPTQTLESLVAGRHETNGIDMAVITDGGCNLVLLDSQPMLSGSLLTELLNKNESPRFGALTPEQQVEVASYQLAVFLMAVCHYVVIVHDGFADLQTVKFLQQVQQKMGLCRLPKLTGGVKDKHIAKLIFVANQIADSDLLFRESELLARHLCALECAWPNGFFQTSCKVSQYEAEEGEPVEQCKVTRRNIPVLILPQKPASDGFGMQRNKYEDFESAAKRWRRFIRNLPNSPSFIKPSTTTTSATTTHHPMNLRDWLSNASRVFDSIRKSSAFTAEYSSRDYH